MQAFSSTRNLTVYAGLNPQHRPPAHPSMLDRAYPRSATPIFEKHWVFLTLMPNASSPFSGNFVRVSNNAMNTRWLSLGLPCESNFPCASASSNLMFLSIPITNLLDIHDSICGYISVGSKIRTGLERGGSPKIWWDVGVYWCSICCSSSMCSLLSLTRLPPARLSTRLWAWSAG